MTLSTAHKVTVRLVRDQEKAWCTCGAVLPIEHGSTLDAAEEIVRRHLAEQQDG